MECRYCYPDTLNKTMVRGKIVLCDSLSDGEEPIVAGAVGSIMEEGFYNDVAFSFPLPVSAVTAGTLAAILKYLNSTRYFQISLAV